VKPVFSWIVNTRFAVQVCEIDRELRQLIHLTAEEQASLSWRLMIGRNSYKVFELFIGFQPTEWTEPYRSFIGNIASSQQILKEYTIIFDETDIDSSKLSTLENYHDYLKQLGFNVYFCGKTSTINSLGISKFTYDALEVYGSDICCSLQAVAGGYLSDDLRNLCNYMDLENQPLEMKFIEVIERSRKPASMHLN
jgi:hypothetical protein